MRDGSYGPGVVMRQPRFEIEIFILGVLLFVLGCLQYYDQVQRVWRQRQPVALYGQYTRHFVPQELTPRGYSLTPPVHVVGLSRPSVLYTAQTAGCIK